MEGQALPVSCSIGAMAPLVAGSLRTVTGADAVQLNLRQWGDGEARYFLIHGFGEGGFYWAALASALASDAAVQAIDLRGHGDSAWDPQGSYAAERYLEDVLCVLQTQNLTDLVLVGHSMGAAIAICVAAQCPDRVRGLILIEGGPYLRRAAITRIREEFVGQPWTYPSIQAYTERLQSKLPLARSSLLTSLAPEALRPNAQGAWVLKVDPAVTSTLAVIDDAAVTRMLHKVSCPALVIRGGASIAFSRASAEKLVAALPDGRLRSVPRAGHAVMFDNPEGLLAEVTAFVDELHARRPRAFGAQDATLCESRRDFGFDGGMPTLA